MKREPYLAELHWTAWESAALRLEHADRYCSSPFWCVPLMRAFHGDGDLFVYRQGDAMAVFHEREVEGGRLVLPPDGMWTLGTPLLGANSTDLAIALVEAQMVKPALHGPLKQITLTGLYESSSFWKDPFWMRYSHWSLPSAARRVASLEGGADGFLSRRSKNFRSRLRRTVKKALLSGVTVELMPTTAGEAEANRLLDRAMTVESASWKGQAGQGVDRGDMARFYRAMVPLLAAHGRLRGLFLHRDGKDLAYLFGASFGGYFRGLQFSYLEPEAEGLGNVAQWMMIERLVGEGCEAYDLGQAMEYKVRWAEREIPSRSVAFLLGET